MGPDWYVLRLRQEEIARTVLAGQFVQVLCSRGETSDPLLRRPFSVYSADRNAGTFDILYTIVGRGTRWMAGLPAVGANPGTDGDLVDVEGPFGNTFTPPGPGSKVFLVGGGVGVAPLYFWALEILGEIPAHGSVTGGARDLRRTGPQAPPITLCMGARRRDLLQGMDDFRRLPIDAMAATDDGSEGFHGLVTELLDHLMENEPDPSRVRVYGCGPQGMNESLRALLVERGVWGEICLESLMACGFGICFGCVAPIRKEVGGPYYNRRVCRDGPVFDVRLLHPGILS